MLKHPESSYLPEPHKIEGAPKEARERFYEMAKSRVFYATRDEMVEFGKQTSGEDESTTTALYVRLPRKEFTEEGIEKWIDGLQIVVNKDAFQQDGEDFSDLIPYAIEHELYELWVKSKRGISAQETEKAHLLARRKQAEMALHDGKLDRMIEFYTKLNPECSKELEYARQKAETKSKRRPQGNEAHPNPADAKEVGSN